MTSRTDLLEVALDFFKARRPVIAVGADKRPYRNGWNKFFHRAQTEQEVREEFSNGAQNIAEVQYPACDFLRLDFDGGHAEEAWHKTGIELPPTARIWTPSGGQHLVFKASPLLKSSKSLRRAVRLVEANCGCRKDDGKPIRCGVDFLINSLALIPPSHGYREDPDHPLENAVEIPNAVVEFALSKQDHHKRTIGGKIPNGRRNDTLTSVAGLLRRKGMERDAIANRLHRKNKTSCEPPLDPDEVERIATSVARYKPATEVEDSTDLGAAKRFAAMFTGNLLYSADRRKWIFWNGRYWQWDTTGVILDYVDETIRNIFLAASESRDGKRREALAAFGTKLQSRARIEAMLMLAQSLPEIRTDLTRFDTHPFLFNCANGTIDLKTGKLKPFAPDDYLTKISPTTFDPTVGCPRFMEFLNAITLQRKELAEYLQRAAGYSLTGSIKEQCLFLPVGAGGNGKTTFIEVLLATMGPDYAQQVKTEIFFESKGDTRDYHIADLVGVRLAAACEGGKRRTLAATFVKQATGGEQLIGRRPYEMPIHFRPEFKLWFSTNHQPRIDDTSEGMWRRLHPIPFEANFPEDKRIQGYEEVLLTEKSGILNWMLHGCLEWQRKGLNRPDVIKAKTKEYRQQEDVIGNFIEDCYNVDAENCIPAGELYSAYVEWCKSSGEKPETNTSFGRALSEKGFRPAIIKKQRVRLGLCTK